MPICKSYYINKLISGAYIVVRVKNKNIITVSHFSGIRSLKLGYVQIDFCSTSCQKICELIYFHIPIYSSISCDHALYLGRELYKAEMCIIMRQFYIQD